MACCIIGALLISQILIFSDRLREIFGVRSERDSRERSAAYWSPRVELSTSSSESSIGRALRRRGRVRLGLALAGQSVLVLFVFVHWDHLGAELSQLSDVSGMTSLSGPSAIAHMETPPVSAFDSRSHVDPDIVWCRAGRAR